MTAASIGVLLQSVVALLVMVQTNPNISPATKQAALQSAQQTVAMAVQAVAELTRAQALTSPGVVYSPAVDFRDPPIVNIKNGKRSVVVTGVGEYGTPVGVLLVQPQLSTTIDAQTIAAVLQGQMGQFRSSAVAYPLLNSGAWGVELSATTTSATVLLFDASTNAYLGRRVNVSVY